MPPKSMRRSRAEFESSANPDSPPEAAPPPAVTQAQEHTLQHPTSPEENGKTCHQVYRPTGRDQAAWNVLLQRRHPSSGRPRATGYQLERKDAAQGELRPNCWQRQLKRSATVLSCRVWNDPSLNGKCSSHLKRARQRPADRYQ